MRLVNRPILTFPTSHRFRAVLIILSFFRGDASL